MKKPSLLILMATLALVLLSEGGCGQKGPLYLPEHNEVVITSPVSPEATEARPQPLPGEQPTPQGAAPAAPAPAAPGQAAPGPGPTPQTQDKQSASSSSPPAANPAQPQPQPR